MSTSPTDDPRFVASVDMLGRTGATSFQIRYDDEQDPVVWVAVAQWGAVFECAAGMNPLKAVLRLLEHVVDGGKCTHCRRPTAVSDDWTATMPLGDVFCWYIFDPEVKTFRRSCEGDTTQDAPTGRNDPCPCGSGLKYKRCCGA